MCVGRVGCVCVCVCLAGLICSACGLRIPVYMKVFYLQDFGGPTLKPMIIWSNCKAVLDAVNPPNGRRTRAVAAVKLGKRWWDRMEERWKFLG